MMQIQTEKNKDHRENEILIREAFWNVYQPGCDEHLILHKLRNSPHFIPELCLVARQDGKLIGSIVYAKLLYNDSISNELIGFGPIAVLPEFQKTGIGSTLIAFSFEKAKELGYKAVLITGDPAYYSRFGFLPASSFDLHLKGNAPEDKAEYFMAAELEKGYLSGCSGIIDFAPEYYDVKEIDTFDKQFAPKQKREAKDTDIT